jgi:hypothetical protein
VASQAAGRKEMKNFLVGFDLIFSKILFTIEISMIRSGTEVAGLAGQRPGGCLFLNKN